MFYWIRSDYSATSVLTPRNIPDDLLGLKYQIQILLDKTIILSNRIAQLELALEKSFFEINEIEKSEFKPMKNQSVITMKLNYFLLR